MCYVRLELLLTDISFITNAKKNIDKWKKMYKLLLDKCTIDNCLFVIYEELKEDTIGEMLKILKFLGTPVNENVLYCLKADSTGKFRNRKRSDEESAAIEQLLTKIIIKKDLDSLYDVFKQKFRNNLKMS